MKNNYINIGVIIIQVCGVLGVVFYVLLFESIFTYAMILGVIIGVILLIFGKTESDSRQAELSQKEIDKIEGNVEQPKPKIIKEKPKEYYEAIKHIRMRYAKGEITEEEYEKMKKKLED